MIPGIGFIGGTFTVGHQAPNHAPTSAEKVL